MAHVTRKMLEHVVDRINVVTGSPATSWTRTDNGRLAANVGNYHISGAYGGVSLHRMVTDGGGVEDVFSCGHVPKRDLYERCFAFLAGIDAARED